MLDFGGIADPAEALAAIAEAQQLVTSRPEGSVLTLTYVAGARFTREIVEALKRLAAANKPYVKAGAVVGMTGLQRAIYIAVTQFSGRRLETFAGIDEAKDWLARQ